MPACRVGCRVNSVQYFSVIISPSQSASFTHKSCTRSAARDRHAPRWRCSRGRRWHSLRLERHGVLLITTTRKDELFGRAAAARNRNRLVSWGKVVGCEQRLVKRALLCVPSLVSATRQGVHAYSAGADLAVMLGFLSARKSDRYATPNRGGSIVQLANNVNCRHRCPPDGFWKIGH